MAVCYNKNLNKMLHKIINLKDPSETKDETQCTSCLHCLVITIIVIGGIFLLSYAVIPCFTIYHLDSYFIQIAAMVQQTISIISDVLLLQFLTFSVCAYVRKS